MKKITACLTILLLCVIVVASQFMIIVHENCYNEKTILIITHSKEGTTLRTKQTKVFLTRSDVNEILNTIDKQNVVERGLILKNGHILFNKEKDTVQMILSSFQNGVMTYSQYDLSPNQMKRLKYLMSD